MYHIESSLAALHEARSRRLYGSADPGSRRRLGLRLRRLLAHRPERLGPLPAANPAQSN